jgi:hypothetical protein
MVVWKPYILGNEASVDNTVDVTIPLDADVAKALHSRARREAAGRYLSGLLKDGRAKEILAEAIGDAKQEARASGLTDDDVDLYMSRDATPAKSAAFD